MWRVWNYGYSDERLDWRTDNARTVSSVLSDMTPADLWVVTNQEPVLTVGALTQVYQPEHAVQFEDGRIGFPASYLIQEDDATFPDTPPDWLFVWFLVMSNESGEWLLDDELHVCIGDCDDFIAGGPVVYPDFRIFEGTPAASPAAFDQGAHEASRVPLTPQTAPWIAAISPEECIAEPMPIEEFGEAISTDPGPLDRSYEIVGPADPASAREAVAALRAEQACDTEGSLARSRSYHTEASLFFSGPTTDNARLLDEALKNRNIVGQEWSAYVTGIEDYDAFVPIKGVEVSEEQLGLTWEVAQSVLDGPNPAYDPYVVHYETRFNPGMAMMLADGRLMVPGTSVYWQEDPMVREYGFSEPPGFFVHAQILKNDDGIWLIDEEIPLCFGDCDEFWSPTPVATPIATPEN